MTNDTVCMAWSNNRGGNSIIENARLRYHQRVHFARKTRVSVYHPNGSSPRRARNTLN